MWIRSDLKARAKSVLSKRYWVSFAVSIVTTGIISTASGIITQLEQFFAMTCILFSGIDVDQMTEAQEFSILFPSMLFAFVFLMLLDFLISAPLVVGKNRFYMDARAGRPEFNNIIFGFTGNYKNAIKTMFFMNLKVALWSLLLVIPGIIKSYQYFFIPYLMAENPSLSTKRAFEISKQMTDGEKLNIWIMQVSFAGWSLLGILACVIGILFVIPYYEASFAELYAAMRDKAFHFGFATADELPGFGRPYQRQLPQG